MSLYQPAADFILLLLLISHVNSDYDRAPLFRSNQNQQDFQCQGPQLCFRRLILWSFSDPAARRTALQHPSSFPTSTLTSGGRCQYRGGQLSVRLPLSPAASSLDRPCTPYLPPPSCPLSHPPESKRLLPVQRRHAVQASALHSSNQRGLQLRSHSLIDDSARQPPLASPTSWDDDRHQSEQVAKLEFALNHDGTRFERCAYDDLLDVPHARKIIQGPVATSHGCRRGNGEVRAELSGAERGRRRAPMEKVGRTWETERVPGTTYTEEIRAERPGSARRFFV